MYKILTWDLPAPGLHTFPTQHLQSGQVLGRDAQLNLDSIELKRGYEENPSIRSPQAGADMQDGE
jgi:hypothetical protein